MNKALIFPGAFQIVKNYGNYDGWDIWLKPYPKELPAADYYIGHSGGVHFILKHLDSTPKGKFIFVNPEIRKRGLLPIMFSFFKASVAEDIIHKPGKTPISSWPFGLKTLFSILKVDVLNTMLKIPKENIIVIKGRNDNYFCNKESVEILRKNGFTVVEANAGHDWNQNIAEMVKSYIS
jgi:hypothetical protein